MLPAPFLEGSYLFGYYPSLTPSAKGVPLGSWFLGRVSGRRLFCEGSMPADAELHNGVDCFGLLDSSPKSEGQHIISKVVAIGLTLGWEENR